MALLFFQFVLGVVLLLFFPLNFRRLGDLNHRFALFHRFKKTRRYWFHASSLGEVEVLATLLKAPNRPLRDRDILLSVQTRAGFDRGRTLLSPSQVVFAPFDFGFLWRRFLRVFRPEMLFLIETEIWPSLLAVVAREEMPLILVNGRIGPKTRRWLPWLGYLVPRGFPWWTIFSGDPEGSSDFRQLFPRANHVPFPNLKFGADPILERHLPILKQVGDTIICLGSWQNSEILAILPQLALLVARFPRVKFLVFPRHPETNHLQAWGDRLAAVSCPHTVWGEAPEIKVDFTATSIIFVNRLGYLKSGWAQGDLAVVGGGFHPGRGGQNPLEPLAFGKPVVFGPHMDNFHWACGILEAEEGGAKTPLESLPTLIARFLSQPETFLPIANRGAEILRRHHGAPNEFWNRVKPQCLKNYP